MDLSDLFQFLFSEDLQLIVLGVVGATKIVRNLLGSVKGVWALVITVGVSGVVGVIMFSGDYGWLFAAIGGLAAGVEAAGLFAVTKLFGKNVTKLEKS